MSTGLDLLFKDLVNEELVSGTWYRVQWTPDVAGDERLNIGVVFENAGKYYIRTIEDKSRFNCLYGDKAEFHVGLACEIAESMIETKKPDNWHQPQLHIDEAGFAQGETPEKVINELFTGLFGE